MGPASRAFTHRLQSIQMTDDPYLTLKHGPCMQVTPIMAHSLIRSRDYGDCYNIHLEKDIICIQSVQIGYREKL